MTGGKTRSIYLPGRNGQAASYRRVGQEKKSGELERRLRLSAEMLPNCNENKNYLSGVFIQRNTRNIRNATDITQ